MRDLPGSDESVRTGIEAHIAERLRATLREGLHTLATRIEEVDKLARHGQYMIVIGKRPVARERSERVIEVMQALPQGRRRLSDVLQPTTGIEQGELEVRPAQVPTSDSTFMRHDRTPNRHVPGYLPDSFRADNRHHR